MPVALTCTCGARLEIDDKFAGQTIHCPDCQKALQAPPSEANGRRTSGLALASLILALTGAFTVVGTIAAVILGAVALVQIARQSQRLAGKGYAVAGIVIGLQMTAATVLALVFAGSSLEIFGLTGLMSGANWAGKLDHEGPLEVVRPQEGFAIKRPSTKWGVFKRQQLGFGDDHVWDDLLLVVPEEDMVVLCYAEPLSKEMHLGIEACKDKALNDFKRNNKEGLFINGPKGVPGDASTSVNETRRPESKDKVQMVEMQIDKRLGGESKAFLMRVYKPDGVDQMFVVIGGVRRSQFARLQGQIREAMDGFRILPQNAGPD